MRSRVSRWMLLALVAAALWAPRASLAAGYQSYVSLIGPSTLIDFEGLANGTLIDTQYAGVTFSQELGGRPQIDVFPMLFGYGTSSGSGALTGSTEGGYPFDTVAGIVAAFGSPQSDVEVFLSDTSPLGDYTISALDSGGGVLETVTVLAGALLPPGYTGGFFPPPGTFPLPGLYVGFSRPAGDIAKLQVGPSGASADSFGIDDLRYGAAAVVPEPGSLALLGAGLLGLGLALRRRRA